MPGYALSPLLSMSDELLSKLLKGGYIGDYIGEYYGVIKEDTRSLDYSSDEAMKARVCG